MEGLTFQPGNLNILVSTLGKGGANLTLGRIYQATVLGQAGIDKFLLQVGGQQVLAENQANLQVGEVLKLLVKEADPGRLILQRVTENRGIAPETAILPFNAGDHKLIGLLKRFLGTEKNVPASDQTAEAAPQSTDPEAAPLSFPWAITWQNQPLQGELQLWNWQGEQGEEEAVEGEKVWRALLYINSLTLGDIKADIFIYKKDIQVLFRSQVVETQKFIEANLFILQQALEAAGLQVKKLANRSIEKERSQQTHLDNQGLDLRV